MPYSVRNLGGARPYKIIKKTTGKVVGTSTSAAKAKASIRAREMGKQEGYMLGGLVGTQKVMSGSAAQLPSAQKKQVSLAQSGASGTGPLKPITTLRQSSGGNSALLRNAFKRSMGKRAVRPV